jgi:hypothetical protein
VSVNQLPRKYKFLYVISLIYGVVLLWFSFTSIFELLLVLILGHLSELNAVEFFNLFFLLSIIPGIILIKSYKLVKGLSLEKGLFFSKTSSIILIFLSVFPIVKLILSIDNYGFNSGFLFEFVPYLLILLAYPIFFFIFKKKLPEVSSESMENGLLDSEEIL